MLPDRRHAVGRVAEVVLHVAGAQEALAGSCRRTAAKISRTFLPMMLTSTLSRPRWAMPMTISSTPCCRGRLDEQVEHRDHALGPLEREALGADVVLVDELLEDLGVGELREDAERPRSRSSEARLPRRLHALSAARRAVSGSSMCVNSTPIERQYVSSQVVR